MAHATYLRLRTADIWSFGITALELSQGHAPLSRLPPVKVLLKTLQDEPPTLDRTGGVHKYSKVMEDFVRLCLQKDPNKRPSADKLLGHAFFKQAKGKRHLVTAILGESSAFSSYVLNLEGRALADELDPPQPVFHPCPNGRSEHATCRSSR